MIKTRIFYKDESASYPGRFIIRADLEKFHLYHTTGSFNIIGARLMGLTYAQYLRMCRDVYEGKILGKGSYYPFPVFKLSDKLEELIDQLNARANFVLWERENPNFESHAEIVKQKSLDYYEEVTNDSN